MTVRMHIFGASVVLPIIGTDGCAEVRRIRLTGTSPQQLVLRGVIDGATDARKSGATGLQYMLAKGAGMRLQCRKTLRIRQYCPSQNWSYNARVLRAQAP
jgi:hypothetical protein